MEIRKRVDLLEAAVGAVAVCMIIVLIVSIFWKGSIERAIKHNNDLIKIISDHEKERIYSN